MRHFVYDNDARKIDSIRFLSEVELQILLKRHQRDAQKRQEILSPEATYFAQISNRNNVYAFWLAGDLDDARRVDSSAECLSPREAGAELYYIRVVLELSKTTTA